MTQKNICILIMARLSSERVKRKVLKKVNGKTLIDTILSKINSNLISKKYTCYFACGDKELIKIAKKYKNLKLIIRDNKSINTDKIHIGYNFVKDNIKEDYVLWLNTCSPFIKVSTILNALNVFQNPKIKSLTTVTKKYTWTYNSDKVPLTVNKKLSTKELAPTYFATHNFHIWNKKFFLGGYQYFRNKKNDPYLFEMNDVESLDIDTEDDLKFVRRIK